MDENQPKAQRQPAMGPADFLIAEYKAQMSDLMHAAMVTQTNFQLAAKRAEIAENDLAAAKARIAELEAKIVDLEATLTTIAGHDIPEEVFFGKRPEPTTKIDEQGFPYLATDNAAVEGDEAA